MNMLGQLEYFGQWRVQINNLKSIPALRVKGLHRGMLEHKGELLPSWYREADWKRATWIKSTPMTPFHPHITFATASYHLLSNPITHYHFLSPPLTPYHPLSAAITSYHPLSPTTTHYHPLSPAVTPYYPLSIPMTSSHSLSPLTTFINPLSLHIKLHGGQVWYRLIGTDGGW